MATSQPAWQTVDRQPPVAQAFHVEWVIDPFTRTKTIGMVRHAGHAFVMEAPAPDASGHWISADWHMLGARYLEALAQALKLKAGTGGWIAPRIWAALMSPLTGPVQGARDRLGRLHWLDITWCRGVGGVLQSGDPHASFLVDRESAGARVDRTVVLLAGCLDHGLLLGTDMGLRITMHLDGPLVRVHGVTLAGLAGERAMQCQPDQASSSATLFGLVNKLRAPIGDALGQGKPQVQGDDLYRGVWINGLERVREPDAPPHRLRVSGFMRRVPQPGRHQPADTGKAAQAKPDADGSVRSGGYRSRIHDFSVDVDAPPHGLPQVVTVRRNEFAGSAATPGQTVRAFLADGATQAPAPEKPDASPRARPAPGDGGVLWRRPTRSEADLQHLRRSVSMALDTEGSLRQTEAAATPGDPVRTLHEVRGPRRSRSALAASTMAVGPAAVVLATAPVGDAASARSGSSGGDPAADPAGPEQGAEPASGPPFWTDEQASVEAHVRATELFDRFAAYGIDPHAYFRFARLPLVQRARAALQWVPDGDLPGAEVRPFLGDSDLNGIQGEASLSDRPQLLVKYGSADPMHRHMVPVPPEAGEPATGRSRAQYLGVASDPRWAWHEFGHVLNFASTGELEFAFAHSAGDALGAIASDPLSALAPANDPEAPLRFHTFPWIEVPGRLHGRRAIDGYCWCGRRNLLRLDFSAPLERHHHGYFEEQILSSSLFRLYRSLGGDTGGHDPQAAALLPGASLGRDAATRLAAADWCIYLVMRAISLLGPDSIAPARTADQFVSALVDADLGTGDWQITTRWPLDAGERPVVRRGGRSHKVIRWAFERQGLDATDDPTASADGPGRPPLVEVFIADSRPDRGPDAHPGGYAPVPLRWTDGPAPWHAAPDVLQRVPAGLQLQLRNRGRLAATGLSVRAWWAPADPAATASPDAPGLTWSAAVTRTLDDTLAADDAAPLLVEMPSPQPDAPGAGWLLVALDAAADPSNLRPDETPPNAAHALMHLVAADNNLALLYLPAA